MAVRVGRIFVEVDGKATGLERVLGKASRSLGKFGAAATSSISAPLAAIGGLSLRSFAGFEDALNRSISISDDFRQNQEELAAAARKFGNATEFGATKAAEAYFFLASAGLDAKQSIAALPQVLRFAQAGNFDLSRATDLATDAQSALGLTSKNAAVNLENLTRVTDVLVKANTVANATTEQFSEALTNKAASAARQVGIDIEELVATLAVYADQGVKGAEAGTRISIALRDLQTKAIQNKAAFRELGVAVFDSSGEIRNLADIIGDLEGALAGASDEQKKATLLTLGFTDKSVAALLALIGFSDAIREYEKDLRGAGGTTEKVANQQLQTLTKRFALLRNQANDVAISIGEQLAPTFTKVLGAAKGFLGVIRDMAGAFSQLPQGTKDTIIGVTATVASIGPLALALSGLLKLTQALIVSIRGMGAALLFLTTNPVGLALTAIGALAAVLTLAAVKSASANTATQVYASTLDRLEGEANQAAKALEEARKQERLLAQATKQATREAEQQAAVLKKAEEEGRPAIDIFSLVRGPGRFEGSFFKEVIESQPAAVKAAQEVAAANLEAARAVKEKSLAGLEAKKVAADLAVIREKTAQTLIREAKLAEATGDVQGFLSTEISVLTSAIRDSITAKGEDSAQVQSWAEELNKAKERLKKLQEQSRETSDEIGDGPTEIDQWTEALNRAAAAGALYGDSQATIQNQIEVTRAAIDSYIAALDSDLLDSLQFDDTLEAMITRLGELEGKLLENQNALVAWGDQMNLISSNSTAAWNAFADEAGNAIVGFANGAGQAVGRALIFSEDLGEGLTNVVKNIAAQFIGALISMAIQLLIFEAISAAVGKESLTTTASSKAGETFANVYASVTSALPFPANIIAAPLFAAASSSAALGGALAFGAFAEGGLVTGPMLGLIGEAGPELITPLERVPDLLERFSATSGRGNGGFSGVSGRGAGQPVQLVMDGRVLGEVLMERLFGPDGEVHLRNGTTGGPF